MLFPLSWKNKEDRYLPMKINDWFTCYLNFIHSCALSFDGALYYDSGDVCNWIIPVKEK